MLLADQIDVVRGLICRNYNIFVVNNGQGFYNIRIFEYRCYFCTHWPFEFSDSNLNLWPNSFNSFWKLIKLLFLVFHPFFGIVLHRVHEKFEVVFPIYGLWLSIVWTFNKDFTEILIVYDAQLPRNNMTSGTIFEWSIVAKTIRWFSFEAINADVLQ